MATNISNLGQQISLISRVKNIQVKMSQYQQQISTGIKYQSFKDYGPDSLRIQRYRADLVGIEGYIYNIDIAQNNIEQMDSAISETIAQAGNILSAISVQLTEGSDFDLANIKSAAKTALQIIEANMNSRIGDRYMFAGSDVSNKPYNAASTGVSNVQSRISDWLDGTLTTSAFLTSLDSMTDSQLGYSTTLQSAKKIFARADDEFEVDYTVFANDPGFKQIVMGLTAISELEFPTENVDIPDKDQFFDVLNSLYQTVQSGVGDLRTASGKIAAASQAMNTAKENHQNDRQAIQRLIESTEAADVTDAVVRFQSLQTQLDASYQITAILSQLSLTRVLAG